LEAFAQFASDLDATTKKQLLKGQKLTEVLKQAQYKPLTVANQVSILFAANEGYLDDVENKDIQAFKEGWFEFFNSKLPELAQKLNQGANLEDADMDALRAELDNYKASL